MEHAVIITNSLVFHRKDLHEAKHEMQSVFKFSCPFCHLSQMYLPVEASSSQEQYYIRLALHFLICCSAIGEVSHTLQCRKIEQFM